MDVAVRGMREADLDAADRLFRLAFGTFLGLPDPLSFSGRADYVRTRFRTDPEAALVADAGGELVGSNLVTTWGKVGFFGPLSVQPEIWNAGIAKRLLEATAELFADRGVEHAGLFTFANSAKHVGLYQRFGFWPRYLTAVMARAPEERGRGAEWSTFRAGDAASLERCRELSDRVYTGLDPSKEIESVVAQGIGDTVLLHDGGSLAGFAICHTGAGSEADEGACYAKLALVRPSDGAGERFERLLDACAAYARARGLATFIAGVNMGRREAYRRLIARGFRTIIQGVQMARDDARGFDSPDDFVLDDWR